MEHTMHNFLPQPYCAKVPGIYAIINRNNRKIYIGSAMQLNRRWSLHRHDFFRNRQNPYLMRAFKKEPHAFYFEVIEEMPGAGKQTRLDREQFWMNFYQSYIPANGYNLCPKATSCEGTKHGPEYGEAISKRQTGRRMTVQQKTHYRASRTWSKTWPASRKMTEETRKKMSDARKGKKWSEGQRVKYEEWVSSKPYHSNKAVIQMSVSGEVVGRFNSILEAEAHLGKRSNIHSVCKGKRPHCLGFKWKYA